MARPSILTNVMSTLILPGMTARKESARYLDDRYAPPSVATAIWTRICARASCEVTFSFYRSKGRKYCSRACARAGRLRRTSVDCRHCGKAMERRTFHVGRSRTQVFLHRGCMPDYYREHPTRLPITASVCGHQASRRGVQLCADCRSRPGTPRRTPTADAVLQARAELAAATQASDPPANAIHARAQELLAPDGIARATVYNVLNRLARSALRTDNRDGGRRLRRNAYQRRRRERPEVRERRRLQKIASRRAQGVPPASIAWPCGTRQAYDHHCRNRARQRAAGIPEERIDDECRRARREEYDQPYHRARQLAATKPE